MFGTIVSVLTAPKTSERPARRAFAWVSIIALAACVSGAPVELIQPSQPATNWSLDPAKRVEEWREDIDALVRDLPVKHKNAFFKCKREDFAAAAEALKEAVPTMRDDEVVVGLMKLTAMIGDGHTGISAGGLRPPFHSLPLSVYLFSDGPVIVGARESQKDLIGCALVKFGQTPAEEALRRASAVWACENEASFKQRAPQLLGIVEVGRGLGLVPTADGASITVRDAEGKERTVDLTPLAAGEKVSGPKFDQAALPLSRRPNPHRNWFELLPDRKILYFRYNTCADEADQTVKSLGERMLKAIDDEHVDRLIVDVRANGGGNSALLDPFINALKDRESLNKPGGVVVLVGRQTFSSAHLNAMSLKKSVGAVLIGEPTGQKPNAYGEVKTFTLPRSKIAVQYSTKFWKTEEGDRPSTEPDVTVLLSSKEFFAGKDPVMEAAVNYTPK